MDIGQVADVHRHGHARVLKGECFELGVADPRPAVAHLRVVLRRLADAGDLHEVEREVALAPRGPPVADHRLIARLYADSRVQMIYGGTNEIMKELIGRSFG